MKLHPIHVSRLQNVEFGQFITRLFENMDTLVPDFGQDPELQEQLIALRSKSGLYDKALQQIKAQQETADLAAMDEQRDFKITTLRKMISVYNHSDDPAEQEACKDAETIMNKYNFIETANYEAESKSIQLMLAEWNKPEHATTITTLALQKLLDNLKKAAQAFDDTFNKRSTVVALKEIYDTKAIRMEMKTMYDDIANDMLAMAKRKKSNFYIKLLDVVNNGRRYFADILAKRAGNNKSADTPLVPEAAV